MEETMTNNKKIIRLILLIALPIFVGLASAAITGDFIMKYGELILPKFAPPSWVFPIAWTILYILMGLGSYFLWSAQPETDQQASSKKAALTLYFVQLAFNFAWSLFFFTGEVYVFSFIWLIIMWLMIIAMVVKTSHVCKKATALFVPYLLWCTFAAYLNVMVAILN